MHTLSKRLPSLLLSALLVSPMLPAVALAEEAADPTTEEEVAAMLKTDAPEAEEAAAEAIAPEAEATASESEPVAPAAEPTASESEDPAGAVTSETDELAAQSDEAWGMLWGMDWRFTSTGNKFTLGKSGKTQELISDPEMTASIWDQTWMGDQDVNWSKYRTRIVTTSVLGTVNASGSLAEMFANYSKLSTADVAKFDTTNVTDLHGMFANCTKLTSLTVSGWNTANVTNMNGTFNGCSALTSLNVAKWNTASATNMSNLFRNCSKLTSIDVSKWNTSSVTTMYRMFKGCSKLTSLDLSNWNTSQVTNTGEMFADCSALTKVKLGKNCTKLGDLPGVRWKSAADGQVYTPKQISASRLGIADTYTRVASPFIDVTEKTAHVDDILWLSDTGISTGWSTSAGKEFRPNADVKRGDMAAFLFRLAKRWGVASDSDLAASTGDATFLDVDASTAHREEILWLAEKGISTGWEVEGGREFRPNQNVKRGDMAAFMYRLAILAERSGGAASSTSFFRDVDASTYFHDEIWWLAGNGVTQGWGSGSSREYRPTATVKRGDMAAFLHRLDGVS